MPNTREKLIDKIDPILKSLPWGEITPNTAEQIADRLIEEGVTFAKDNDVPSKWIPVSDRLPESGCVVLGYMISEDYRTLKWKNNTQRWEGLLLDYAKDFVTHWMPLPEPPKGE